MIGKKRIFTALCIFFVASIVTGCSFANSQDSNKKDNTSNTEKHSHRHFLKNKMQILLMQ